MQPDPAMFAQAMMGGPETLAPALEQMAADPMMGAGMEPGAGEMGAPMGAPPEMGGGAPAPFPSLDPMVIAGIIEQVKGIQAQDHMNLQMQQDTVLAAVMQALGANSVDPALGVAEGAAFGAPEAGAMDEPMPDEGLGF